MQKHFNLSNINQSSKWKSKGLSYQYLDAVGTLGDEGTLVRNGNGIIAGGPIVNIYIVYKTSPKTINSNFIFKNCLFGAIKIANTH